MKERTVALRASSTRTKIFSYCLFVKVNPLRILVFLLKFMQGWKMTLEDRLQLRRFFWKISFSICNKYVLSKIQNNFWIIYRNNGWPLINFSVSIFKFSPVVSTWSTYIFLNKRFPMKSSTNLCMMWLASTVVLDISLYIVFESIHTHTHTHTHLYIEACRSR
jgi:hypothetical protein